ncbi:Leucine-rich_repeat domain superfamily [Hexamita inflata]|uniref:Leucine-rich repeat domain superfamily n=1 Tax=Hexamita inflata TaxID=28002 RepID=A0AA86UZF7_9EUKA|nr:Leucine-rich repeat domain superfamily [Hexamita inflata]
MTELNQNILNQEHDAKMTRKFKGKIQGGNLDIGNYERVDPDVRNLSFLEKFNIQTLKIYINEKINLKLRNNQIKELTLKLPKNKKDQLNWNIDDFELENLEILQLQDNQMKNDQLYNIAKFKKLQTLDVSQNNVDLMHIHCVISLTKHMTIFLQIISKEHLFYNMLYMSKYVRRKLIQHFYFLNEFEIIFFMQ